MIVREHRLEGAVRAWLDGTDVLDSGNAAQVKRALLRCLEGAERLVVDLSGIEFVDSAGVGVLISLSKAARLSGRRVVFAGPSPGVRSVLALIRIDAILDLYPDAPEALRSLREDAAV